MGKSDKDKFSLSKRGKSFKYAFRGLIYVFSSEHNAWIHVAVSLLVICAGFLFHISTIEWGLIAFAIGFVFTAEIFNTAFEKLTDLVSPEINSAAGLIKDIAAGAVLISALTAVVIGIMVFLPYIMNLFR